MPDDGVLERHAVGSEDGPRRARDLQRPADVAHLAEAHLLGPQRPGVLHPSEVKRHKRSPVQLERHLRELLLRELVGGDRLPEDDALLRVLERGLEACPSRAHRAPDDPEASLVQAGERPAQGRRLRKDVVVRHADILEDELRRHGGPERELAVDLGRREAGHPFLDDEAADRTVVGSRPDDRDIRDRAVRDPHLRPVQDPVRAVAPRMRSHRAGIGAGVGLGQAEAADRLARVHGREPPLLLLLRAPAPDREHRERALHRDRAPYPRVSGLELQAGQPVRHRARPRQAVAVEVHAEEPELRELGHQLARKDPSLEPIPHLGQHSLADELPNRVANRPLLVLEKGVDREQVEGIERGKAGRGGRHRHILRDGRRSP